MAEEKTSRIFLVSGTLAVVCSLVVSLTAIGLGPQQDYNREQDRKKSILEVAGLYDPDVPIDEAFKAIETRLVNIDTGEYVPEGEAPAGYDQRLATSTPALSEAVPGDEDVAGLSRREKYSYVYIVRDGDRFDQVILPVRGRGLFSTLYAFLSLDSDLETVRGIAFYEHGETAGLGAEVENPKWRAKWSGKKVYNDQGAIELRVVKGAVDPSSRGAEFKVDGLSGATMTSNGVSNLLQYWFGESGFEPYLEKLKQEGGSSGRA